MKKKKISLPLKRKTQLKFHQLSLKDPNKMIIKNKLTPNKLKQMIYHQKIMVKAPET